MPKFNYGQRLVAVYTVAESFFSTGTEDIRDVDVRVVKQIIRRVCWQANKMGFDFKVYNGKKQEEAVGRLMALRDELQERIWEYESDPQSFEPKESESFRHYSKPTRRFWWQDRDDEE